MFFPSLPTKRRQPISLYSSYFSSLTATIAFIYLYGWIDRWMNGWMDMEAVVRVSVEFAHVAVATWAAGDRSRYHWSWSRWVFCDAAVARAELCRCLFLQASLPWRSCRVYVMGSGICRDRCSNGSSNSSRSQCGMLQLHGAWSLETDVSAGATRNIRRAHA